MLYYPRNLQKSVILRTKFAKNCYIIREIRKELLYYARNLQRIVILSEKCAKNCYITQEISAGNEIDKFATICIIMKKLIFTLNHDRMDKLRL